MIRLDPVAQTEHISGMEMMNKGDDMQPLTLTTKEGTVALIPGITPMITIMEGHHALTARILPERLRRLIMQRDEERVTLQNGERGNLSSSMFNNRCLLRLEFGAVVVRATINKPLRDQMVAWMEAFNGT